jgi:hypothetical protein
MLAVFFTDSDGFFDAECVDELLLEEEEEDEEEEEEDEEEEEEDEEEDGLFRDSTGLFLRFADDFRSSVGGGDVDGDRDRFDLEDREDLVGLCFGDGDRRDPLWDECPLS